MKRRLLASLLAVCMVLTLMSTAFAANSDSSLVVLRFSYSYTNSDGELKKFSYVDDDCTKPSLNEALEMFARGTFTIKRRGTEYTAYIDSSQPITIIGVENETINKKVVITATEPDNENTGSDALVIYNTNSVTIQTSYKRTGSITFSGGLEIQSGAKLTLLSGIGGDIATMNCTFGGDLIVDGTLTVKEEGKDHHVITMNFGSNSMEIGEEGTVALNNAIIAGSPSGASALITNNGVLTITQGLYFGDDDQPSITATGGPAIQNNGTLDISCPTTYGDLKITSNSGPAIIVAENATLKLVSERVTITTENTDEQAIAALASMGESRPAIASGTIRTL